MIVLQKLNEKLLEMEESFWFLNLYLTPITVERLEKIHHISVGVNLKIMKNIVFDTQCDIQDILNIANNQRLERNNRKMKSRVLKDQVLEI